MKNRILALLMVCLLFAAPLALAAQESVWDMAQSEQYGKKAGGMLGRGLINVATCFVDLIVQTVDGTQNGPPFVGTLTGLGGGLGCSALRVSSGALDVLTFWVPGFNGIPVGRSYSNCLEIEEGTSEASAPGASEYEPAAAQPGTAKRNAYDYVKK